MKPLRTAFMKRSIPILLYHHVAPVRDVTPGTFETQLQYLLDRGYRSLSIDEVLQIMSGTDTTDVRGFAVTFDDGYLDNWLFAFPVLQKLRVQAIIYLVTERVEPHAAVRALQGSLDTRTHEREPGGFLSWAEVRAMAATGLVRFGSHSHTHRDFVRRNNYSNIEDELRQSKELIEKESRSPCVHLAWPWGDYEPSWIPVARRLGYQSAATTRAGANTTGSDPWTLKRLGVRHGSTKWLRSRLAWNVHAWSASLVGSVYGLDQSLKVWWNKDSPYPHG